MKSPTSLISIRNAVGVMLALSAIFAIVVSTISMPGDRAFGQTTTDTNATKVQKALDTLEDELWDPDLNADADDSEASGYMGGKITLLQAAVAAIPTNIQPDTDNNDAADPGESNFAIEVDNPGYDADETAAEYAEKISINSALTNGGGTAQTNGLDEYLTALSEARGPVGNDGTEAFELALANITFTTLKGMLWNHDSDNATPSLALTDDTKSTLDGLNNGLLTATPADLAAFKTSVEDALKDDDNWYPDGPPNALPTSGVTDADNTSVGITDQLNILFNAAADPDTGAVHDLSDARTKESEALAGAKSILEAVKTAVDAAVLPAVDKAVYPTINNNPASDTEAEVKATADENLATAKKLLGQLVTRLNATNAEEFTALDELAALETVLKGVGVTSPSGVTMMRIKTARTALLKNNIDTLGVSADDNSDDPPDDRPQIDPGEIMRLKADSLNHIISALGELYELDGTGAQHQKAAIKALDDVLTKVDDLHNAAMPLSTDDGDPDINDSDLTKKEVAAFNNVEAKFKALQTALANRHIDTAAVTGVNTAGVDADITALMELDNDGSDPDVTENFRQEVAKFAGELTTQLGAEDGDPAAPTAAATALLTKLKTGILASAVSDTDLKVSTKELADALKLTIDKTGRADNATQADGDNTADKMGTDDFGATLDELVKLDDDVRAVHAMTSIDIRDVIEDLDDTSDDFEEEIVRRLAAVQRAATSYRAASLQYDSLAAMTALQDALQDLDDDGDGGDIEDEVNAARDALRAAYSNSAGLNAAAKAEIATAFEELIRKASAKHAYAQKPALLELKTALEKDGDGSTALKAAIVKALETESPEEQQARAMISRIEPEIRGVTTVSAKDVVRLSVLIYGLQDKMDQNLAYGADKEAGTADDVTFDWGDASDNEGPSISYTAPSSAGRYTVKASLDANECYHADATVRAEKCSAEFEVKVLRPSAAQPQPEAPVNPPGDIPSILADSEGNQYAVFTPVEGGTFSGEGYSITAASGAVPNGEFIGVRMSDDGAASNAGMTHQRYTLGGNMYGVHAVDSSSNAISSTELDDPATVCVPLPDELRSNISDLAVVAINSDGSLTILSAQVKITTAGTMVCGGLSSLPASVAVGSAGAPAAIPTPTPEPTPEPPDTGGTAPASSATALWALLLGIAVLALGTALVIARRREGTRKS